MKRFGTSSDGRLQFTVPHMNIGLFQNLKSVGHHGLGLGGDQAPLYVYFRGKYRIELPWGR
jgi:hypothetical protein